VRAGEAGREERGLPAAQALERSRRGRVPRGVEQHGDEAVHVAGAGGRAGPVEAELPRDGGAHGVAVEPLALDLRGAKGLVFVRDGLERGAVGHPDEGGLGEETAPGVVRGGQRGGDEPGGPREAVGPGGVLPEVGAADGRGGGHSGE
jgi:hypothetical protein